MIRIVEPQKRRCTKELAPGQSVNYLEAVPGKAFLDELRKIDDRDWTLPAPGSFLDKACSPTALLRNVAARYGSQYDATRRNVDFTIVLLFRITGVLGLTTKLRLR
jgi:hypothetical protein